MADSLEKAKLYLILTHDDRIERFKLQAEKELFMVRNWKDVFLRQRAKQQWMQ